MYKFYCDLCGRESKTHNLIKTPYFHYYKSFYNSYEQINYNKEDLVFEYDKRTMNIDEIEICEDCAIQIATFLNSLRKS